MHQNARITEEDTSSWQRWQHKELHRQALQRPTPLQKLISPSMANDPTGLMGNGTAPTAVDPKMSFPVGGKVQRERKPFVVLAVCLCGMFIFAKFV